MTTVIHDTFTAFRDELDAHHDRRERLIKTSRDITNLSKKIIFSLHRLLNDGQISLWQDEQSAKDAVGLGIKATEKQFAAVQELFASMREDLTDGRYWRYMKPVSGGLQEYIEALSFAYFLRHHTLMPYHAVEATLKSKDGAPIFPLTVEDYLLGVSDLSGEIMRLAITSIGTQSSGLQDVLGVCALVRAWHSDLEALTPFVRDLRKKQDVTAQSLHKIEAAAYSLSVRGAEYGHLGDFKYDASSLLDNRVEYRGQEDELN